jgi:prepilin-type N-terminal cleavage/methylation domain-containing protein
MMTSTQPTPAPRRRSLRRRGMTLIEVMIALVILTGALLGMGRFITSFSHSTTDGSLSSTASDLVLDRLEQIKAYGQYTNIAATFAATEAAIPGYPNFTRITQVLRTNTSSTDYTAVTVTVSNPSMSRSVKKTTIIAAF